MAKQLKISLEDSDLDFQLFGINSFLKDYRLCTLINDFFEIDTRLIDTTVLEHQFSVFGDQADNMKVILIQNKCMNGQYAFPKLDSFEYIVIVDSKEKALSKLVHEFSKNKDIIYITNIKENHISQKGRVLVSQLLALV